MKIPVSGRKKALFIVDVQPAFLNAHNKYVLNNIKALIQKVPYDLYIAASFHAEKGSLWGKQQDWILPKGAQTQIDPSLLKALKRRKVIILEKETKSIFKGDKSLYKLLKQSGIEEVHLVGLDTNDCVLASAYESFDSGFITYAVEECCQSSSSEQLHQSALELLRHQCLTNNSCIEKINFKNI
jgi:nicotinamidase-related amidase